MTHVPTLSSPQIPLEKRALIRPLAIGSLQLPINVFYAPLAGCSDYPFRSMSSMYKPGLHFCEMVKMDALVRADQGTFQILNYDDSMHPIGAQLCGSNPQMARKAATIIQDLGFDLIDLNCGCPVDKVTKDGGGSGLLKMPHRIGEIVSEMVSAVTIPVTVKIRAGWDDDSIIADEIVRIVESAGAKAITVHGRTREQGYEGRARREWIRNAKQAAVKIPVIGNGDIFTPYDAFDMLYETGCDGVLIARGTMGQPWIVDDIRSLSRGEDIREKSLEERRAHLLRHFEETLAFRSGRKALIDMRRIGCWYFNASCGVKAFREAISHAQSIDDIRELINSYPFEAVHHANAVKVDEMDGGLESGSCC